MKRYEFVALLLAAPASVALAQVDFTGAWDHPGLFGQEDFNDRPPIRSGVRIRWSSRPRT
jgi:hypothetical protein